MTGFRLSPSRGPIEASIQARIRTGARKSLTELRRPGSGKETFASRPLPDVRTRSVDHFLHGAVARIDDDHLVFLHQEDVRFHLRDLFGEIVGKWMRGNIRGQHVTDRS